MLLVSRLDAVGRQFLTSVGFPAILFLHFKTKDFFFFFFCPLREHCFFHFKKTLFQKGGKSVMIDLPPTESVSLHLNAAG